MFEKEAEEIAKDIYIHHFDDDVNYPDVLKAITVGVQKGAEFGYNKANEWHWIKDGDFPEEEKELIVNTPITVDVFDVPKSDISCTTLNYISQLEFLRRNMQKGYQPRGIDKELDILVRLLPNSYKVVNLCAERKDICKAKHMVPETPHYGKKSRAVPCYTMGSCNDCGLFRK